MKKHLIIAIILAGSAFQNQAEEISISCFQTHPHLWHNADKQPLLGIQISNIPAGATVSAVRVKISGSLTIEELPVLHLVSPKDHGAADYITAPQLLASDKERGSFSGLASMSKGTCFLWVLGDLKNAKVGSMVDASLESMTISGTVYKGESIHNSSPPGVARVYSPEKRVYGYQRANMMVWNKDKPYTESINLLTDIAFCGMGANADGSLHFANMPESKEGPESQAAFLRELDRLKAIRGKRPVRIHLMIPKGPALHKCAANPDSRNRFVRELTASILSHKLDGADIDWEYPESGAEWNDHASLLYELRLAFFPHGLWLTAAGGTWKPLQARHLAMLDWINIMIYDNRLDHATWDQFIEDIKSYRKFGTRDWQINAGVPFYSQESSMSRNWNAAKSYENITQQFPDLKPDEDAVTINGVRHYFNGPEMIRRKAAYVQDSDLGGVMIWSLVHDLHPSNEKSLLRAIREELPREESGGKAGSRSQGAPASIERHPDESGHSR